MNAASLQAIVTSVAQERSLSEVLHRIAAELAAQPGVALTRIWLMRGGTQRPSSRLPPASDEPMNGHLVLAASAGHSIQKGPSRDWSRLDGAHRRVGLGQGKIGRIGQTGEPVLLENTASDRQWIVDHNWAREEQIVSFAGHPLMFRGEILGVLALFSRESLAQSDFEWLRIFADHAAIAIANARAFEEIDRLRRQLETENQYLREEINEARWFGQILGRSPAIAKLREQISLVAPTDANVLILGESGTGKELVARAIHQQSRRSGRALVRVNCAAVPGDLFESEFFGHVKGSFTGAFKDRVGRFQLAHQGTLFLDEVGEIPLELQGKLLRVLQEGQIERVGDDETRRVDVRVIAATNRQLSDEVAAGWFRQDLYFRLSVFPIEVAPLRARLEDIPLLAEYFLKRVCQKLRRPSMRLSDRAIDHLQRYAWPGNVRELQNVIERAVISSPDGRLRLDGLLTSSHGGSAPMTQTRSTRLPLPALTRESLRRIEAEGLLAVMERTNWKVYGPRGAAQLLGLPPTTLASRLKRLGLRRPD